MDRTGPSRSRANPNWLLALPPGESQRLLPLIQTVQIEPERFVLPAGQSLDSIYFPYSGVVSLMIRMLDGSSVEVAGVGREGMLGVSVLLEADPAPYDMVCQIAGQAGRLATQTFVQLLDDLPTFRQRLLRYALCLLHEIARTAACNRLHSVEQRLARWLLLSHARVGADLLVITHESLARVLGVRRPFVTRVVHGLELGGLIQSGRGRLRIVDREGLEALACEDYELTVREYLSRLGAPPNGWSGPGRR
jgi:CRP-like cAMP-binding protein